MDATIAAILVVALAAVLGLLTGAVTSWFAHGWQEGEDELAVRAPVTCGEGTAPLTAADALRPAALLGRCPHAPGRLPWSWWVAPVATAGGWAVTIALFGVNLATPALLWFITVCVAASVVDLRLQLIPRHVVYVGVVVGVPLIALGTLPHEDWWPLLTAVGGGIGCFLFLFLFHLIMPAGMGFGDVRLGLLLGLYLGWVSPMLVLLGLILGCVFGIVFALVARAGWSTPFPFGPGLATGALMALWFHEPLLGLVVPV